MKWGYIISEVLILYLKFLFIYLAYFFAKIFTAINRPSPTPPITKRISGYLQCVVGVAFIALVASGNFADPDEDDHLASIDYNRGAMVFIALIIPAMVGATEGFTTRERIPPPAPYNHDVM
jgi:hypothetical protein